MIQISRRLKFVIASFMVLVAVALLSLAAFPASWIKGAVERSFSDKLDRRVTIGAMEREAVLSFDPVLRIKDISVPQPAWAGPGKLASISLLRVRVNLLEALIGRAEPHLLTAQGVTLDMLRGADKRESWRKPGPKENADGAGLSFADIGTVDATVRYRDEFQKRAFTLAVKVDPVAGLVGQGDGEIDGNPVKLSLTGPAHTTGAGWPFAAAITGTAIELHAKGTMAEVLRTDRMTFHVAARANDLKLLDRVIEAGLFGTQPIRVAADVRREPRRWIIEKLGGTIGSSNLTGRLTVDKVDGRTKLDGAVHFSRLDFADLATDAGNAAALALKRAEGPKLVPNTRINIRKIDRTDGRLAFQIDRIVSRDGPSALAAAKGVLTIDHRLLIARPLQLQLAKGAVTGQIRVDQQTGQSEPTVTLALDLRGSSIGVLADSDGGKIDAPVDGRIHLIGVGSTIREAVGHSHGTIGVIAHDGSVPAKMAALLGFDVGRSLITDEDERAALRCAAVRLEMQNGVGTASPLIVDTSRSQTRGTGTIRFPDERIAMTLTGAPKHGSVLRLPGSIVAGGTIREPSVVIPKPVKSLGNVLKAVGRAITGKQGPEAGDANCTDLRNMVLN